MKQLKYKRRNKQCQKDKGTIIPLENRKTGDDMYVGSYRSWVVVLSCAFLILAFSSACLADPRDGDRYPSVVLPCGDGDRYPSVVLPCGDGDRYPS